MRFKTNEWGDRMAVGFKVKYYWYPIGHGEFLQQ